LADTPALAGPDPEAALAALRHGGERPPDAGWEFFDSAADALAQHGRVDPDESLLLLRTLQQWVADVADLRAQAFVVRAAGNQAFLGGLYPAAIEHYRQALQVFQAAGMELEEARTLSSLVHPLAMVGDHVGSLATAEAARSILERRGDLLRLGRLDINLGGALFRLDRFPEALAAFDRATVALSVATDREAMAAVLISRAVTLISLARFDEAESTYVEAREFARRENMPVLVAQADYNIGYLYFLRGQYVQAIHMLDRARATATRYQDRLHLALCDLDQSDVCIELNLFDDAVQLAGSALAQFRALSMPYESGKAITNMAVAEQHRGKELSALELLTEAATQFQTAGNQLWVHVVDLYRAVVLLKMGRCFEAIRLSEEARVYFQSQGVITKEIYALVVVAHARTAAEQWPAAEAAAQAAQAALQTLDAPWLRFHCHSVLAELAVRRGDWATAASECRLAIEQTEAMRGNINFDELRISFMRDKAGVYERYLGVLLRLLPPVAPELILQQMERAKARSLVALMSRQSAFNAARPSASSAVVSRIMALREELNWYYRQLDPRSPPGEGRVDAVVEAIRVRERDLLRAIRLLPEGEFKILQEDRVVDLAPLQGCLPDATLVEFAVCEEHLVAAVVDRTGVEIVPLGTPLAQIEAALRLLRFQVGKRAMEPEYYQRFAGAFARAADSHLQSLYDELIRPLESRLREEHIVFVPHGILHALPFHALHDRRQFLIDRHTVSVAPSATVLALCCQRLPSPHTASLLVAAEPKYAAAEVEAVARHLPGAHVLERTASSMASFRQWAEQSRLIHIAAHGIYSADNPYFSSLEMADGRLNVIDVYNLRLDADLVVLSGCGTALGNVSGGDEVVGLIRAFLYGGARSIVASLWDVNDRTTARFMKYFYSHLADGCSLAKSLQGSMLELRAEEPHPLFWAPFVLTGNFIRQISSPALYLPASSPH